MGSPWFATVILHIWLNIETPPKPQHAWYTFSMNLILTPEMQRFVDECVRSGQFATPEDVVLTALAALMRDDPLKSLSADEMEEMYPGLREKIAEGVRSADAGELVDGEEFFAELEREDQEAANKAGRKSA
jgi:Arc/MetJ-type ribon-helix-helix transcriptional regulator